MPCMASTSSSSGNAAAALGTTCAGLHSIKQPSTGRQGCAGCGTMHALGPPPLRRAAAPPHRRTWHGTLPLSRMGSPAMSASAMVPGPALVMITSDAPIHSWMLSTKPAGQARHTGRQA